ncbi:MAG: triacylglycerol lipase [Lachnospiraceae bacterium]|nr:triacylglycerol lipase [Lachnospiraceae bacterium]
MIRKLSDLLLHLLCAVLIFVAANVYLLTAYCTFPKPLAVLFFLTANALPLVSFRRYPNFRLRICNHGVACLKIFLLSTVGTVAFQLYALFFSLYLNWMKALLGILLCIVVEALIFWNGILCVYLTSVQLGIKLRVLGAVFGMIPPINLYFLGKIIYTVSAEITCETALYERNLARKDQQVCHTKYPILLVHGVFFRDSVRFNYWGRIPKELLTNGATVFYGNHQSAASIADSAAELAERIRQIVAETGCEKVNIIAHSKGGLDCRYAIKHCGIANYVASLTTVNTPHRGCQFADYLLEKVSSSVKEKVARTYNKVLRKIGDPNPDFLAAVGDLTSDRVRALTDTLPVPEGIYCQSVGSKLNRATGGKFPLNFSYPLVKHFDGANDGLVGEDSFRFGEHYTFLTTPGKRGISHGDVIDLNRENIRGFDVREWYITLVKELKEKGL